MGKTRPLSSPLLTIAAALCNQQLCVSNNKLYTEEVKLSANSNEQWSHIGVVCNLATARTALAHHDAAVVAVALQWYLELPVLLAARAQCHTVPGGPSIACSTARALEWDDSFKGRADCSGRSVSERPSNALEKRHWQHFLDALSLRVGHCSTLTSLLLTRTLAIYIAHCLCLLAVTVLQTATTVFAKKQPACAEPVFS
eukprot:15996-Heterococcus_DN1.PRE.2